MAIYLRSDGVNDVVQFTSAITIASLGTQAWTFRYKGNITAPAGTTAIAGTSSSSTAAGPAVSTTGQMIIRSSANVTVATSPTGFIIFGEDHKYECDHLAGGAISWKRDDIEVGTGSYTGGASWTNINQFFRATSSATARLQADTEYIEFVGTVNANKWDANLSGGTGNTLPTSNGQNQGNLINFTTVDADKWINYGGIPEYTVNITGTYAGYTASVVADATEPVFTVSVAASYASYIAAVNSTNTKPVKTASIVSTYPSYTASVSATGGVSTYTVSVNTTYPKYTANVAVADVNKLSISTSYPAYTSNVTSTNIKPIKTASVVGTYAKYTASVVATKVSVEKTLSVNTTYPVYGASSVLTNIDPIRSVSVNAAYPNYSAAFVVTNVDPINSLNINSTYPKYSASVNAGTLIQDRTLVINSAYPTYIASVVIGDFVSLPYIGSKGAHLVISLGSRDVIIKDKSRNVKWRVENARL